MMRALRCFLKSAASRAVFMRLMLVLLMSVTCVPGGHAMAQVRGDVEAAVIPPPDDGEGPTNNGRMDSQSVPTSMVAGFVYNVVVTMKNTGSKDWYPTTGHMLASVSPDFNTTWGPSRVGVPSPTLFNQTTQFYIQVRAPATPGTYTFQWRMMQEGVGWFGTATTPLTINVREAVNNAQVLGQNIPAQMYAGERQELTVTMQNTGDLPWTRAQQYTLMAQAPHNNMTWGLNRVPLPVETVNPGESTTFRFVVTAPANLGTYTSQWGMQREGYGSFGGSTSVVWVNVREPVNSAQPAGQSVPALMESGKPYNVSVTMVNNGESTWTRDKLYTLMSHNPQNNTTWGFNRVPLPVDSVAPGQSVTFTFQVIAPTNPGLHTFQWGMQREGYGWFGQGTNPAIISVDPPVNSAQVVSIVVPPRMQTQLNYNVAVTMRNNGTTTWTPGALYRLGSQNPHDNQIWGPGRIELTSAVAPGQQYTFNFQVKAPASGDYQMQWGMVQDGVQWFGAAAGSPVTVTEDLSRVTFIHTDGLGSPVARTDGAGTVLSRTRYEPYGYVASGATPTIGFTGHVNDADTGLTYMQQRYYDPVAGRFLSIDPVVTDANTGGSFNRYVYAKNNPYIYIDPDGRRDIYIGGGADKNNTRIVQDYAAAQKRGQPGRDIQYFSYSETKEIAAAVSAPLKAGEPLNLIGHSLGGREAVNQANSTGATITNLITIDPVGSAGNGSKSSNVGAWTDVTAVPSSRDFSDTVASTGRFVLGTTATSGADSAQKIKTSHGDFDGMMSESGSQKKVDASY